MINQLFNKINLQKIFFFFTLFILDNTLFGQIKIHTNESYELANIILAITPYGKSDPWEVYKNTIYYQDVIAYFDKYSNHPLISKVNYSRESWDKYLSFRTDSYGYEFDSSGTLRKTKDFYTIKGINEFEENIDLINDFIKVSGFREFYNNHSSYYDHIIATYQKSQMVPEILQFLKEEFKIEKVNGFTIVISPLVNRMNCQVSIDNIPTSFITLPTYIFDLDKNRQASQYDIAKELHMLFTEIDHEFVNPTTEKFKLICNKSFNPQKWDLGSGYENYTNATFNEYMTWAIYDLFVYKYFPQEADDIVRNWHLQNESRKFFASTLFGSQLKNLYDTKQETERIIDLYPKLLEWCQNIQDDLSLPYVINTNITFDKITLSFSEEMSEDTQLDAYINIKTDSTVSKLVSLDKIYWSNNGKLLSFQNPFDYSCDNELYFNATWKTKIVLKSSKGIHLTPYTKIEYKKE
ncbi:MAG TPA: hypothetical protein DCX03_11860 [Bacteroidales bacterium]|nr:hypothetical protein [Bacteroidales bacterium]